MTLLVEHARSDLGLPMRGMISRVHVGWTTDAAKAEAFISAGGQASFVRSSSLTDRSADGYELRCYVGQEVSRKDVNA